MRIIVVKTCGMYITPTGGHSWDAFKARHFHSTMEAFEYVANGKDYYAEVWIE